MQDEIYGMLTIFVHINMPNGCMRKVVIERIHAVPYSEARARRDAWLADNADYARRMASNLQDVNFKFEAAEYL